MTDGERERLEALGDEIASLAAHMEAAMCRWLGLVAEYDEREGWVEWGCRSCSDWLAHRCSLSPTTARDHVRVARRLRELPLIREAFARGELSYSKVRALTRVEDVTRERDLLELAQYMTASQLERTVRGYRRVLAIEAHRAHEERFLRVEHCDDGSIALRGRLSREEGAVLLKALEAMRDRAASASAEAPDGEQLTAGMREADALVALADAALAAPAGSGRTGGERYQVVVHVDAPTLGGSDPGGRCELDDRAPLSTETVRRLCCDASMVALLERDGKPLSVGRKTRSIPPALRRALRSRDRGCRFPGCNQHRRVDAHHVIHWADGGATSLENVVELCRFHHRLVHEGGYTVETRAAGALCFRRPDGRTITPTPARPRGDHAFPARLSRATGLTITPDTLRPGWLGEKLELVNAVEAFLTYTARPALTPDG